MEIFIGNERINWMNMMLEMNAKQHSFDPILRDDPKTPGFVGNSCCQLTILSCKWPNRLSSWWCRRMRTSTSPSTIAPKKWTGGRDPQIKFGSSSSKSVAVWPIVFTKFRQVYDGFTNSKVHHPLPLLQQSGKLSYIASILGRELSNVRKYTSA